MGYLFGLLLVGVFIGLFAGRYLPLPGGKRPRVPRRPVQLLGIAGAVALGLALGLYGPVLLFALFDLGTGSYEDVLFIIPITLPALPIALGMITARLQKPRG